MKTWIKSWLSTSGGLVRSSSEDGGAVAGGGAGPAFGRRGGHAGQPARLPRVQRPLHSQVTQAASARMCTYSTECREEVERAPETNHPCNLTRTSVKISFPEMKRRIFVNFLGYKEPNLIHLPRCKGRCGDEGSTVSCVPTRHSFQRA